MSSVNFTGEVKILRAKILSFKGTTADIQQQIIGIEVYEDIFSPFRTMNVVLRESVDFLNLFPFIGEELINIKIETPGTNRPIEGLFYVYRVSDRVQTKDKEVVYTLKAISQEWVTDINSKISKTFLGEPKVIVNELITQGLGSTRPILIGKTTNKTAFTAGYWSPVKCLNHLAKLTIGQKESPTFLFFENRNGFNFECINDLLLRSPYQTFNRDNFSRTLAGGNSLQTVVDPQQEYQSILEMSVPETGDFMRDMLEGKFKSTMFTYDITKGVMKENKFEFSKMGANQLNPNPGTSNKVVATEQSKVTTKQAQFATYNNISNVTNYKYHQHRQAFFNQLLKFKTMILVKGRTDYTVGQVMKLDIPKMKQMGVNNEDKILSGNYLLSAICHNIYKDGHKCTMELIKDSTL